jgi:hypothetical protein
MTSFVPSIKAQYFISAKDKKIMDYLFSHHDNGDQFPILRIKPLVGLHCCVSPTQSTSTKTSSSMFPPLL